MIMDCTYSCRVQASHDGMLNAPEREQMAAHLSACPACSAELARLRNLSAALAHARPAELSVLGMARVRARVVSARLRRVAQDNSWRIVRVGEWLTAAAAAIMLACGMALYASDEPANKVVQPSVVVNEEILDAAIVPSASDVGAQSEQEVALLLAVSPNSANAPSSLRGEQP